MDPDVPTDVRADSSHILRLGDFGLSKNMAKNSTAGGVAPMPEEERAAVDSVQGAADDDVGDAVTSGVLGTLFYISPEIEKVHACVLGTLG